MVIVYYTHRDRLGTEYTKEFTDVYEARTYKDKMEHLKDKRGSLYIVSYSCDTEFELKVMERIYK